MNLIAFKLVEHFYGFYQTHVALRAVRSAMRCIGRAMQRTRWAAMTHPKGRALFPASYVARRLWYTYHGAARALPAEKIAPVK